MYLDTCIVVKLLVPEPDSATFDQALRGQPLVSSEIASTEVASALLARERSGALRAPDRRRALQQFQAWLRSEEIALVPLDSAVLRRATRLLERCHPEVPLRTLDAIHLATADVVMAGPLCTTDGRLRAAARRVGLDLYPPA